MSWDNVSRSEARLLRILPYACLPFLSPISSWSPVLEWSTSLSLNPGALEVYRKRESTLAVSEIWWESRSK
jgi:hypothetical protein